MKNRERKRVNEIKFDRDREGERWKEVREKGRERGRE